MSERDFHRLLQDLIIPDYQYSKFLLKFEGSTLELDLVGSDASILLRLTKEFPTGFGWVKYIGFGRVSYAKEVKLRIHRDKGIVLSRHIILYKLIYYRTTLEL